MPVCVMTPLQVTVTSLCQLYMVNTALYYATIPLPFCITAHVPAQKSANEAQGHGRTIQSCRASASQIFEPPLQHYSPAQKM